MLKRTRAINLGLHSRPGKARREDDEALLKLHSASTRWGSDDLEHGCVQGIQALQRTKPTIIAWQLSIAIKGLAVRAHGHDRGRERECAGDGGWIKGILWQQQLTLRRFLPSRVLVFQADEAQPMATHPDFQTYHQHPRMSYSDGPCTSTCVGGAHQRSAVTKAKKLEALLDTL